MTHFEVRCSECVGGVHGMICPFQCSNKVKPVIEKVKRIIFYYRCTCSNCPIRWKCEWAYDEYNTDGDCLAVK